MADIQKALYDIQGNRITPETVAEAVDYDNAESGLAATDMQCAVDELESEKIAKTSIADNLTTDDATKVLSAKQGKTLKDAADTLTSRVTDNEADIANRYTKQQAVRKFAYLEEAEGNSVQIVDTVEAPFAELEVLGETVATPTDPESPVSPDNPQTLTSLTSFDYLVSGKNLVRQNQTIPQTVNGVTLTYDAGTDEYILNGTASNPGTFSVYINSAKPHIYNKGVKRTISITKTSGTSTGEIRLYHSYTLDGGSSNNWYIGLGASDTTKSTTRTSVGVEISDRITLYNLNAGTVYTNLRVKIQIEIGDISAWERANTAALWTTITLKDTTDTQLYLASYLTDCDKIIKRDDDKWYHRQYIDFKADATTRSDYADILDTPVDTELCTADQTALNEIEAQGTFDGTTNIMLSTELGEVNVKGAKDITKVISDMASAIALLG